MATLDAAIRWVQSQMRAVPGVEAAPDYMTDSLGRRITVIAYPGEGLYTSESAGWHIALHDIVVEVHCFRSDLERNVRDLSPFLETIPGKILADPTFGGNVSTYGSITRSSLMPLWDDGGTQTIGYRFIIKNVKILGTN